MTGADDPDLDGLWQAVAAICDFLGALLLTVSFWRFPWLMTNPRKLFAYFSWGNLVEGALQLLMLLSGSDPDSCSATVLTALQLNGCQLASNLWLIAISHSIYQHFRFTRLMRSSAQDAERLMRFRATQERCVALYCWLCWGLPVLNVALSLSLLGQPGYSCTATATREKWIHWHATEELVSVLLCTALFLLNVREARHSMRSLALGTELGSIRAASFSQWRVYVGLFVVFGLLRGLALLVSAVRALTGEEMTSRQLEQSFEFVAVTQNLIIALWLALRFKLWALWRKVLCPPARRDSRLDSTPLIESVGGVF